MLLFAGATPVPQCETYIVSESQLDT